MKNSLVGWKTLNKQTNKIADSSNLLNLAPGGTFMFLKHFLLFILYDGPIDMQTWALLTRCQCRVFDTGPLGFVFSSSCHFCHQVSFDFVNFSHFDLLLKNRLANIQPSITRNIPWSLRGKSVQKKGDPPY